MGTNSGVGQTNTGTNTLGPETGGIVGAETGGNVTDTVAADTSGNVTDTVAADTSGNVTDTVDAEFTEGNPGAEFTDGNPGAEFTDGNPGAEFVTGLPGAEFVTGNPGQSVAITGDEFKQAGRFTSATTIENMYLVPQCLRIEPY